MTPNPHPFRYRYLALANRVATAWHILRTKGPCGLFLALGKRFGPRLYNPFLRPWVRSRLKAVARRDPDAPAIVYVATGDLTQPFRQRQNHLAPLLSHHGMVFYISPRQGFDDFAGITKTSQGLWLTDHLEAVLDVFPRAAVVLLSVDHRLPCLARLLEHHQGPLVYDYIDALDASVDRMEITPERLTLHAKLLADPNVRVAASARVLYREARKLRGGTENLALVTNGVDVDHYRAEVSRKGLSERFLDILDKEGPLLGYFGALAAWIDYPLLIILARSRPDCQVVLIGGHFDRSAQEHRRHFPDNLHLHPRVDYDELPRYAAHFDVCMIPFVLNRVTEATSPLKLFEYMALGKPIISTAIPEAANYDPVLTASSAQEFAALVDEALTRGRDPEHLDALRRCAEANSWESKAADFAALCGCRRQRDRAPER